MIQTSPRQACFLHNVLHDRVTKTLFQKDLFGGFLDLPNALFFRYSLSYDNAHPISAITDTSVGNRFILPKAHQSVNCHEYKKPLVPDDFHRKIQTNGPDVFIENKFLEQAINKLPQNQQEFIYLHYLQGYAQKEAADMLAVSPSAVSQLKRRALKNLRIIYKGDHK